MTYITFQATDTAQLDNILAYAKKKNLRYEISDSVGEILTKDELLLVEKSLNSGMCNNISELKEYLKSQI